MSEHSPSGTDRFEAVDETVANGGICPVCGDEFIDGFGDLDSGESYDVRMCVVEIDGEGAEALIHLDEVGSQTPPECRGGEP